MRTSILNILLIFSISALAYVILFSNGEMIFFYIIIFIIYLSSLEMDKQVLIDIM